MNKKLESRRATSNNNHSGQNVAQSSSKHGYAQPGQGKKFEQNQNSQVNRSGRSPAQSFSNIQKISARLRARNPVIMSMTTSPQMLLPLSQRSLSPSSYQQLQTAQQHDGRVVGVVNPAQMPSQQIQGLKQSQVKMGHAGNQPNSREFNHQRKILHKSLNSTGVHPQKQPAHMSMDSHGLLDQRAREQAKSSAPDQRTGHASLNMSQHMISSRQQPNNNQELNPSSLPVGMSSDRATMQGQMDGHQSIHLSKKFSGHRGKRNARDRSYDLYNQKLQLPPMMKPGHDSIQNNSISMNQRGGGGKQDRTYSLPSAGQVHQSMPLSPNMAMQSINSPKGLNHPLPQRQSINDALKSAVSPSGQQSQVHNNRFQYNSANLQHQNQQHGKMQAGHNKTQQSQQVGSGNINMKGFFSARGQGIRNQYDKGQSGHSQNEISKNNSIHTNRSMQAHMGQGQQQMQGVFSPRRKIMSGQTANAQFVGVRQPQPTSQQRQQSSPKNKPLHINTPGQTSDSHQAQPQSATSGDDMRYRQSIPLSPRQVPTSSQSPPPVLNNDSHRLNSAETDNQSKSTSAESKGQPDKQKTDDDGNSDSNNSATDANIQFVEVQTLLFGENPPILNPKTLFLKNHEPTKASQKKCGAIKSYAANTNQGIIRDYNEDRVSIILNILKPKSKQHLNIEWPQICFFGVFDGHGGAACADYLRDNLHNFVVQNDNFPQYPQEAIMAGFKECERNFLNLVEAAQNRAQQQMPGQQVGPERSGSCATVVMIIEDTAYVVNVGDSRCLMSIDAGAQIAVLSRDHKPDDELERIRIQAAGGKIYRTQTLAKAATSPDEKDLYVQGPLRVFPGRLSVSKTFGDIEAKRQKYGGNPNVIVCEPEIKTFKLKDNFDFFLIGCDGIFERLDNKQVIESVWDRISEQTTNRTYDNLSPQNVSMRGNKNKVGGSRNNNFHYDEHIAAAEGVEIALREAAASRSLDNITVLILGLKNLKQTIKKLNEGQTLTHVRQQNYNQQRNVKHTYDQDFECLEVNEQDLYLLSDNDMNSANDSQEADATCTIEAEKKKTNPKSISSPTQNSSKGPASRPKNAQSTSAGVIPRKF